MRAAAALLQQGASTTFLLGAPQGNPWVKVFLYCGGYEETAYDAPVAIAPANPALDAIDRVLQGVGSSNLVTDPTMR